MSHPPEALIGPLPAGRSDWGYLIPDAPAVTSHPLMGPSERPSPGWLHKEAEMRIGLQPAEKSRGWRPGDRSAASSPLPPALSFLLLLPLGECLPLAFDPSPFCLWGLPSCKIMVGHGLSVRWFPKFFPADICSRLMKAKGLSELGKWRA